MSDSRTGVFNTLRALFVWGAWAWLSVGLVRFILTYASRVPMRDDLELVPFVLPSSEVAWGHLWSLHNEHRVPLPKLVAAGLFDAFDDVRAPMILNAVLLSLLAAAMMWTARKIRGSTALVDVVFPFLWLSTGNAENLLMAFQLALVLPTVLVCTMMLVVVRREREDFSVGEALVLVACLAALPLCGGPGITQWPAFALGIALATWWTRRPFGARIAFGVGLVLAIGIVAAYLVGYERPPTETPAHDVARTLSTAWRVIASAFGPAGATWWPLSGLACAAMALVTFVISIRAWRERVSERPRIVAILAVFAAVATLALAIGWSRGGSGAEVGSAVRYVTLPGPWIAATFFACLLYGDRVTRVAVPGALALILAAAHWTQNKSFGRSYGAMYSNTGREFEHDLLSRLPVQRVVTKWTERTYPNRQRLFRLTGFMARARVAPFDACDDATRRKYAESIFDLAPAAIQAPAQVMRRFFDELRDVLAVPTDSKLFFEVPTSAHSFQGVFGVPPIWVQRGTTKGIRAIVRSEADGSVLFDRTIDPVNVERERGPQAFVAYFPTGSTRRIVLEIVQAEGAPHTLDWAYWADAYFE